MEQTVNQRYLDNEYIFEKIYSDITQNKPEKYEAIPDFKANVYRSVISYLESLRRWAPILSPAYIQNKHCCTQEEYYKFKLEEVLYHICALPNPTRDRVEGYNNDKKLSSSFVDKCFKMIVYELHTKEGLEFNNDIGG